VVSAAGKQSADLERVDGTLRGHPSSAGRAVHRGQFASVTGQRLLYRYQPADSPVVSIRQQGSSVPNGGA